MNLETILAMEKANQSQSPSPTNTTAQSTPSALPPGRPPTSDLLSHLDQVIRLVRATLEHCANRNPDVDVQRALDELVSQAAFLSTFKALQQNMENEKSERIAARWMNFHLRTLSRKNREEKLALNRLKLQYQQELAQKQFELKHGAELANGSAKLPRWARNRTNTQNNTKEQSNAPAAKSPEADQNVQPIDHVEVTGQESVETDSMMAGLTTALERLKEMSRELQSTIPDATTATPPQNAQVIDHVNFRPEAKKDASAQPASKS